MYKVALISVLVILVFIGSSRGNGQIPLSHHEPAFVIDTLRISANVQSDTIGMPHMSFFTVNVTYHFDGKSGNLMHLLMSTDSMGCGAFYSPAGPIPANLRFSETQEFMDPCAFTGQDSIYVRLTFEGTFVKRNESMDTTNGTFTKNDSMWVRLRR